MRVIIAESSDAIYKELSTPLLEKQIACIRAKDGKELSEKCPSFKPTLALIALDLPLMHGIEATRLLKKFDPSITIAILGYVPMVQDVQSAFAVGATSFLLKSDAQAIAARIIEINDGHAEDFQMIPGHSLFEMEGAPLLFERVTPRHYLRFAGTRGSLPVSGADFIHYGGHTSCLEVRAGKTLVIIDAGSGITQLGERLVHENFAEIHLLISHTHWDHIIGLPFFAPLYQKDRKIIIWAPVGYEDQPEGLFASLLFKSAFFPVRVDEIRANIEFRSLYDGQEIELEGMKISCHYALHPGSTLGFILELQKRKIAYFTDNEMLYGYHGSLDAIKDNDPRLAPHQALFKAIADVDLLIHEAQYTPTEYLGKVGWGHSSFLNASILLRYTKAKRWIVTHHDPTDSDIKVTEKYAMHRKLLAKMQSPCALQMGYDGLCYSLDESV